MRKFIVLFTLMLSTFSFAFADDWNKQYTVTGKPELHVDAKDGNIYVSAWDKNQIDIHVTTIGYKIGADGVRITDSQSANRVTLDLKLPHTWCVGFCHREIKVEVRVPRQSDLDLKTGDGNMEGGDVQGNLEFNTGDGNVSFHDLQGSLRAHSGDGNIRVGGRFENFSVRTGDGNVAANIDSGSKPASGWSVYTGDGNVQFAVPQDLAADLDVRTGDGRITFDLPVTVAGSISRSELHGKLNAGGPLIQIRTGDGNVHLEKR